MWKQVGVGGWVERAVTRLALRRGDSGMTWSDQPLEDAAGRPVGLDGELRWRRDYAIRVDEPAGGFVVTDDDRRAAVFVPLVAGGYRSQSQVWSITVEHRRFGWRLVAQPSGDNQVTASAQPGVRPGAYALHVAPDLKVVLARGLLSSGRWELRYRRQRIAQIGVSDLRTLTSGRCISAAAARSGH